MRLMAIPREWWPFGGFNGHLVSLVAVWLVWWPFVGYGGSLVSLLAISESGGTSMTLVDI